MATSGVERGSRYGHLEIDKRGKICADAIHTREAKGKKIEECDAFAGTDNRWCNQEAKRVCFWVYFRSRNGKEDVVDIAGQPKRPTPIDVECFGVTSTKKHDHGRTRKKSLVERCRSLRQKFRDDHESEDERSLLSKVSNMSEDFHE